MAMVTTTYPGKLNITGEYCQWFGYPTILGAIDRYTTVSLSTASKYQQPINPLVGEAEKIACKIVSQRKQKLTPYRLSISSTLHIGSGMGSSSSVSAAIIDAILQFHHIFLTKPALNELVFQADTFQHGDPAGDDNAAVVFGGLIRFQKKDDVISIHHLSQSIPQTYLIHTGTPKETSKDMLTSTRALPTSILEKILHPMGKLAEQFEQEFTQGNWNPSLLSQTQHLLEQLNVVSENTIYLVREIEKIGGFAKISGAGGRTNGSGMLLVWHKDEEKLHKTIKKLGYVVENIVIGKSLT